MNGHSHDVYTLQHSLLSLIVPSISISVSFKLLAIYHSTCPHGLSAFAGEGLTVLSNRIRRSDSNRFSDVNRIESKLMLANRNDYWDTTPWMLLVHPPLLAVSSLSRTVAYRPVHNYPVGTNHVTRCWVISCDLICVRRNSVLCACSLDALGYFVKLRYVGLLYTR